MKCQKCGRDTFLPFRCRYCGGCFCPDHHLPENHECPQVDQALTPREEQERPVVQRQESHKYTVTYPYLGPAKRQAHFTRNEIRHLAVAALLVLVVGLSLTGFSSLAHGDYFALALFITMFTMSFLTHEIAHKVMAQRHGLWAEFRLTLTGTLLTLISTISPIFKVIAPGAVLVSGSADRKTVGKTSIAGPTTNIILATAFLAAAFLLSQYNPILAPIAAFNAWIAVFNLIPIEILDGFKIFTWDKRIWTLVFAASVVLVIVSYQRL